MKQVRRFVVGSVAALVLLVAGESAVAKLKRGVSGPDPKAAAGASRPTARAVQNIRGNRPFTVGIIGLVKAAQPTTTPARSKSAKRTAPEGKLLRKLTLLGDNKTHINEQFWIYLCGTNGTEYPNVDVTAYLATIAPGSPPDIGGEVTDDHLTSGGDYFYGSETVSPVPACIEGGPRGQLHLKVHEGFLDTPYGGILLQVSKRDGDVDTLFYIEVIRPAKSSQKAKR